MTENFSSVLVLRGPLSPPDGTSWSWYIYFLGDFNDGNFQIIICSCPSTDMPSFVEKYPKIKWLGLFAQRLCIQENIL
jgi:hypothetical protein